MKSAAMFVLHTSAQAKEHIAEMVRIASLDLRCLGLAHAFDNIGD